jgi:TatD DNase family protein
MIDTHCHLADQVFADDLADVVSNARAAGVETALCILAADSSDEASQAVVVGAAWPEVRFATGIHPHRAAEWTGRLDEARHVLEQSIIAHDAIAVGEIGLDYHYEFAARDVQREVFALQLDVATTTGKPVVIHARESIDDTVAVLRQGGPGVRGVMHCFTGTVDEARRALDLGFYVSLSGIVTFPRSTGLREVAAFVPIDRLLVETDAPYLAPVPHRGRRNQPAWVVETVRAIAGLRSIAVDELSARLAANTAALMPELGAVHVR